jgi:hypothetical protein
MIPPSGWEHSHGKTQYITGKQVLVRSIIYYYPITSFKYKKTTSRCKETKMKIG